MIRWRGDRVHILVLPDSLSREITAYADLNKRSFNAEVTSTLEEKYTGQISAEARLAVLNSLLWSLERDAGPDVVNSSIYQLIRQIRDSLKGRQGSD
jgi:hypothetical protein